MGYFHRNEGTLILCCCTLTKGRFFPTPILERDRYTVYTVRGALAIVLYLTTRLPKIPYSASFELR